MEDFIAERYQYAQLIPAVKECIRFCYVGDVELFTNTWGEIQELLVEFCKASAVYDEELALRMYNKLSEACTYTNNTPPDHIKTADELKDVIEMMYEAIALLGDIDVDDEDIRLVGSKSGFLTLQNRNTKKYYHSTVDPMEEAYELATALYNPIDQAFQFLGCGLGYLQWQLFCKSDCSLDIYIHHNNPKIVQYALDYGVLGWIPEDKLHIIIAENNLELIDGFTDTPKEGAEFSRYCLEDVLSTLDKDEIEIVRPLHISKLTSVLLRNLSDCNFFRNVYNVKKTIYDIDAAKCRQDWMVVVAGPSLDGKIEYVRKCIGKKTIIVASTVLKKLLDAGITPDFVVVLDPRERTWGHFEKLENHDVPLIINGIANWRFGEWYKGDKYIAPSFSNPRAVKYFYDRGIKSLALGSTVAAMSAMVAITLGAKNIDFVGLDLAYPGGRTHASGTMDDQDVDAAHMPLVKCVAGGMVHTSNEFKIYIDEMSEIATDHPDINFVNYSENGAYFEGMKWYKDVNGDLNA